MTDADSAATPSPTRQKLPVLETVRLSYVAISDNFAQLVRATGWWAAIAAAAIAIFAVVRSMLPTTEEFTPEARITWLPIMAGVSLMFGLTLGGAWAGAAVAWHRLLLLDEKQSGSPAARWRTTLRYAFLSGALFCIVFAVVMLGIVASVRITEQPANTEWDVVLRSALIAAIAFVANRFSLIYPAVAIGETRMTFAMSWTLTAGNTWRLFCAAALVIVPIVVAADLAGAALTTIAVEPIGHSVASSFGLLLSLFANAAAVSTFYSLAYRHFVARVVDDPADYFT